MKCVLQFTKHILKIPEVLRVVGGSVNMLWTRIRTILFYLSEFLYCIQSYWHLNHLLCDTFFKNRQFIRDLIFIQSAG